MIITISHAGHEAETDNALDAIQAVLNILRRGKAGSFEIAIPSLPPVGESRPDLVRDMADRREMPRRVRKERSDKGKPRRKR